MAEGILVWLNIIGVLMTAILVPIAYFFVKNIRSKPAVDELLLLMRTAAQEQMQIVQSANKEFAEEIRASRQAALDRASEEVKDLRDRISTLAGRYTEAVQELREMRIELLKEVRCRADSEAKLAALETEVRLLRERYQDGEQLDKTYNRKG